MQTARAVISLIALALFLLPGLPLQWVAVRFGLSIRRIIPNLFHRYVCAVIGVRVHVMGVPSDRKPLLITSNHTSWLDIPVLSSVMPLSFVAKSDVAGWPIIGTFARLQRTIFVERTRRQATGATAHQMAERLAAGDPIVLFPEGTSSDGNRTLSFKSALIGAAEKVITGNDDHKDVFIQPVSITYTRLQGLAMTRRDRPKTAWYGDMELGPHLWDLLKGGAVDVVVRFGEPASMHDFSNRKALSGYLQGQVSRMNVQAITGRIDAK